MVRQKFQIEYLLPPSGDGDLAICLIQAVSTGGKKCREIKFFI